MSVRVIAAASEVAANTDTYVSSAQTFGTSVSLPKINDGTGSTVAVGKHIRVESLSGSPINVLTNSGRLVLTVPPRKSAVLVAKAGTVQSEPDAWESFVQQAAPAAFGAIGAAYSQAEVTALRTCLVNAGLMKAE
jgi:hypothetical protein